MKYSLAGTDGFARAGMVTMDHGLAETPVFMPVGTQGTVKAVEQRELEEVGAQIILGNTYHLYLRPGIDIVQQAGGLHRFMAWSGPILTDSGGYQVFSLADLREIEEEGVTFQSHLDGSSHRFTPESVVDIQRALGSDIMMVLDECTPYPCDRSYAEASAKLTVRWAQRCFDHASSRGPLYDHSQALFGIVQGSTYRDIRESCARSLVEIGFDGYAIGGLAVGEPAESMYAMIEACVPILPKNKPRYLMGVGTPENLLEAVDRGIDMFDCVLPTRNGRNAMLFTRLGTMNISNAKYKTDNTPIDPECCCYTCRTHTRAYLRHLFQVKEILALQLATLHNLFFYGWLMKEARKAILNKNYRPWKEDMIALLNQNANVLT